MASVAKPLFTIAIPTFNRASFLDNCLKRITAQVLGRNYLIELIVSDNCSTDDTPEVVSRYKEMGLPIKYIRNNKNEGADFNISQCFSEAKGRYVLTMGDDDFFLENSIDKIMKILEREMDVGIVYIKGKSYNKEYEIIEPIKNEGKYLIYTDKLEFVKRVHYNFTFISGNILRKDLFPGSIDEVFYNSYLFQLSWILEILIYSGNNVVIEDDILGVGSVDNTGGYKLYDVFVRNFNKIMSFLETKGFSRSFANVINKNLVRSFLPQQIVRDRTHKPDLFLEESPVGVLHEFYSKYIIYWVSIFPLLKLPNSAYKYWLYLLSLYNKIHAISLKYSLKKNIYFKKVLIKYI